MGEFGDAARVALVGPGHMIAPAKVGLPNVRIERRLALTFGYASASAFIYAFRQGFGPGTKSFTR